MPNIDAPIALITGASKRIGKAMAEHFHALGYTIIVHYRNGEQEAKALVSKFNQSREDSAISVKCDLQDSNQIDQLIDKISDEVGRLDLLINNASLFEPDEANETKALVSNLAQWERTLNANSRACFHLSQGFAGLLNKHQGSIINLIDIYADRPLKNHTIYSTSKAACSMLTKSLAVELAPEIRVNGISPGAILWPEHELDNAAKETLLNKVPLAKLGSTQAIVDTADYLTRCDYITGQIIKVDGGRSINI